MAIVNKKWWHNNIKQESRNNLACGYNRTLWFCVRENWEETNRIAIWQGEKHTVKGMKLDPLQPGDFPLFCEKVFCVFSLFRLSITSNL